MNMDKLPYLGELQFHILTKKFFSLLEIFTRHKAQAPDQRGRGLGLGTRRGEGARTGESAPVKLLAARAARTGKAQNASAAESALLWSTRGLEPRAAQGPLRIEQPGA